MFEACSYQNIKEEGQQMVVLVRSPLIIKVVHIKRAVLKWSLVDIRSSFFLRDQHTKTLRLNAHCCTEASVSIMEFFLPLFCPSSAELT